VSTLNLDVKEDRSLIGERGGLIDRWGGGTIFGAAERSKRGSVEVEADDVVDAFVEVAVEGRIFRERNKLGGGDFGGRSKDYVSSDYTY
jgi:hypothetical protein